MPNKKKLDSEKEKEIKSYQKPSFLSRIPYSLKAILIKYWYFGAVCFFIGFGVGLSGYWFAFVGGLAGGMIYDIAIRHFLLAMESDAHEARFHIMCSSRKYYSFPINVVYNIIAFYLGTTLIGFIQSAGLVGFGNEPFSMALVMIIVDYLFLSIKWGIMAIISHIKEKKEIGKEDSITKE